MVTNVKRLEKSSCRLEMTNSAKKGIGQWFIDERDFLSLQDTYDVYIEKRPINQHGNMSFSLFFDNVTNELLAKHLNDRVAVMECVYKNEGFLATGFRVRGKKEPVRTNRRHAARLKFHLGNKGLAMPIQLYTSIRELPIAEERSAYVKKRISSWEGYLRIEEKNADVADIKTTISTAIINADFSKVNFVCKELNGKALKKVIGFSAKMADSSAEIGNVVNVNHTKNTVEIELNRKYKELARRQSWNPRRNDEIIFSNFAELSQIRRLRKGFTDLQNGFAANANLEKILFEERPVVQLSKRKIELDFHNELNEFQREAVKGAMTANDLYVIQGPPGTGKTTVISEICHQNVKAGLRTLVASQSNLAVDNALSRLLTDQDVRILRFGRTESIEEEGKKFIEENVALNWKNETLLAVNEQRKLNAKQEEQVRKELEDCRVTLENSKKELTILEEKITLKKEAEEELSNYKIELEKVQANIVHLNKEKAVLNAEQNILANKEKQSHTVLNEIKATLEKEKSEELTSQEIDTLKEALNQLHKFSAYLETMETIAHTKNLLSNASKELELIEPTKDQAKSFLEKVQLITKLEPLKEFLTESAMALPITIDLQINELSRMISLIQSETFSYEFNEWRDLDERLGIAIKKIEQSLLKHHFDLQKVQKRTTDQFKSVSEIHHLLDQIGHYLINPKTKQLLQRQNNHAEKLAVLERVAKNLGFLYGKYDEVKGRIKVIKERFFDESKRKFTAIQLELSKYITETLAESESEENRLQQVLIAEKIQLDEQQELIMKLEGQVEDRDKNKSLKSLQGEILEKEQVYQTIEEHKITIERYEVRLQDEQQNQSEVETKRAEVEVALQEVEGKIGSFTKHVVTYSEMMKSLTEKVITHPEIKYEETMTLIETLTEKDQSLLETQKKMPVRHAIQDEWSKLLEHASAYDLDEIRKLYVQYANVIGTTCVASARKTFMEDYPTFDVVIIDEVSKATPPELLLPMLKGKKIILVGDHHQLPPLVGQETLEELVDGNNDAEEKQELKKLLKESLFERLFKSLPKQNKMMLGIQYRMHEAIMKTITPFYNEANYNLQCGVVDSNKNRDHLLASQYIKREDHLLWFDMPNKNPFFEAQVKGGTSRYNQAELDKIRDLLIDIEDATGKAKSEGRMAIDAKKNVGIISFYGEQVKRIDRMLQHELVPKHLNYRTGSVDKFQGMEMDVIILSFVRNHHQKSGDIGFAKDYRRLNVALSRARELLIIVGSTEMFTKKTKSIPAQKMYQQLLENVESSGGLKVFEGQLR